MAHVLERFVRVFFLFFFFFSFLFLYDSGDTKMASRAPQAYEGLHVIGRMEIHILFIFFTIYMIFS
ncbi:hypothetical protein V8C37DRAFT_366517 [Trichoderma ceciliae]